MYETFSALQIFFIFSAMIKASWRVANVTFDFLLKDFTCVYHSCLNSGMECRNAETMVSHSRIQLVIVFGPKSFRLLVSPNCTIGGLRRLIAKRYRISDSLSISIKYHSKILHNDSTNLAGAQFITGSAVECGWHRMCGGVDYEFQAIPVEQLKQLLAKIKPDYEKWADADSSEWYLSGSLKKYFEAEKIDPTEKYKSFYTTRPHTIAISYVCLATKLLAIAGLNSCFNSKTETILF